MKKYYVDFYYLSEAQGRVFVMREEYRWRWRARLSAFLFNMNPIGTDSIYIAEFQEVDAPVCQHGEDIDDCGDCW